VIFLGGINGTGKTSSCLALEKRGLKCSKVPQLCYGGENPIAFEIYALNNTMFHARGDAVDESPLTHQLYLAAIAENIGIASEGDETLRRVEEGIFMTVRKLKDEGHKFVWLTADPAVIQARLARSGTCRYRPFIEQMSFLLGTLKFLENKAIKEWREEGVVDLVVDTSSKTPEEVAEEVARLLEG